MKRPTLLLAASAALLAIAPTSAAVLVSLAICFAWSDASELRRIMLAISSSAALVSSREAAWLLAPSANVWLAAATWADAAATWSAPMFKVPAMLRRSLLTDLRIDQAIRSALAQARLRPVATPAREAIPMMVP